MIPSDDDQRRYDKQCDLKTAANHDFNREVHLTLVSGMDCRDVFCSISEKGKRIGEMNVLLMCRVLTTSSMESTMYSPVSPQIAIKMESPRRVITALKVEVLTGTTSHPFSSLSF
jgi:hypothetical protein